MPANVEVKARVVDVAGLHARAARLSDSGVEVLTQEDVFFHVPNGRLKLRVFGPGRGELIHYHRPDVTGPRTSRYTITPTRDVTGLRAALTDALGVLGVVCKRRHLYRVDRTRIHVDAVDGLGDFAELEVVLRPDETESHGEEVARDLMDRLGITTGDLVAAAYIDLLLAAV